MTGKKETERNYSFPQKVWISGGIIALIVILILLLKATFNVFLLILAGGLIAVYFRGLSGMIQRKTKWKQGICLTISIISTLLFIGLLLWLIGAKLQSQIKELSNSLPGTVQKAKEQLNHSALGQKIVATISSPTTQKRARSVVQAFFKTSFGILGDLYVVVFIGIFFTASPKLYRDGIITLVPKPGKSKANTVLNETGDNLKKWLKGKLFAMLVVFVLTSIGLVIIGMPMWLALALIAAILNFIPNVGPLIALIPAALIGLSQDVTTAIWVVALYIVVQVAESNFITPLVQQKLISIPPALIIIAQIFLAPLTGGWGLVLATPLMVIVLVLVQELYIKRQGGS